MQYSVLQPYQLERWRSWLRYCAISAVRVRFPMVSLEFFIDITLQAALWPWV